MMINDISVVRRSYNGDIKVLDGLSIDFKERVNIIFGEPGTGKSTLMDVMSGLEKPETGKMMLDGNMVYLMQVPERQFIYPTCRTEILGNGSEEGELQYYLEETGLPGDIAEMSPWHLSKGEKKRLSIARIIKQNDSEIPIDILLLDDPFTDMDRSGKEMIVKKLIENTGFNVIIATANMADIAYLEHKNILFGLYNLSGGADND
ncbi:MAG: ATP-binding cassette domain-containing protein [Elusimicrobiota bacterium]